MDTEFSRKKALVMGVLVLVFLAIPVTVYTALQQQSSSTRASVDSETGVVAIINGEQITKADIRKVAEEQYPPNAVDQVALQDAYEILKERKILDNAARNYALTPDQKRVTRFKNEGLLDTDARYEAIKQQVILAAVNSREASSISFWNPPSDGINTLNIEQRADAAIQLAKGIPALDFAEEKMRAGETLDSIANQMLLDYPDLRKVLSMNGYIYAPLDDLGKTLASYPQIYEFGDSSIGIETRDSLFAQDEGAIIKISGTENNRGGYIFKVEKKGNTGGNGTYEQWYQEQENALVQEVGQL